MGNTNIATVQAPAQSLRAYIRGLEVDIQGGEGGVVHLVVRADQQQKGLIGRIRQHLANALFRAADLCNPGHDHNPLRVVEVHVVAASVDDQLTDVGNPHIRELWPIQSPNGDAHYKPLLVHEGVKRHQDGRPASADFLRFCGEQRADHFHGVPPVGVRLAAAIVQADQGGEA